MRAGTKTANRDPAIVFLAEPRKDGLVAEVFDIDAGADKHHRWALFALQKAALVFQRRIDRAFHAI
ncbi:hypothetical protein D3C81_2066870 [compost metagenome]